MKNFIYYCKTASFNGLMPTQKNLLKELCGHWASELQTQVIDVVVPVPGHPIRTLMQSDLTWFMARYLSRSLGKGEPRSLLKRKFFVDQRFYPSQKTLNRARRAQFIQKQYFVPRRAKRLQNVLLVDDVCTTGASLALCRKLIEERGYQVTAAVVLSKVGRS